MQTLLFFIDRHGKRVGKAEYFSCPLCPFLSHRLPPSLLISTQFLIWLLSYNGHQLNLTQILNISQVKTKPSFSCYQKPDPSLKSEGNSKKRRKW